jgi:hypothetical protein
MSYTIEPTPKRLRIYQQNLNKSDKAQYDLINSPMHKDWDLMLLQEPYVDALGNTRANHHWHVLYPTSHLTNESTKRSVILVNTMLDTNTWAQLPLTGSNDITAIQVRHQQGKTTVFNIYNDCTHSDTIHHLDRYIDAERRNIIQLDTDTMLWCGDFNRHHPMWDEERNHHLFTTTATAEAEKLIALLADYNMAMALPKRIPTLQSMSTKNWTRVDNVFCTDNMVGSIVRCDTEPRMRGPGTDHVPILTILDVEVKAEPPAPYRNFRTVDWGHFKEELAEQLERLPDARELHTIDEFNNAVNALTVAIQDAIEAAIPLSKAVPHSRRWWNKELSDLKKKKNRLNNLSYIYRAIADHPSHEEHRQISEEYGNEIKKAKTQHWIDYLEDLDDDLIWSANRYLSNPATDGGKSRIPSLETLDADGTTRRAETNEDKSCALAKAFFPPKPATSQIPSSHSYPRRVAYQFRLHEAQLRRQISKLKPHKAPGDDGIPNVVLKESADLLIDHLLWIYRAAFALQAYSDRWRSWITVVLRKPGKADYSIPKSHRPIALYNTMGKLLTAIIAEDMMYMTEKYHLLPANHFGGRPGRTTTDSLHLIVNKIKGAWRRKKVAVMLFLDIEGAFPHAVTDRLLHNMRKRRLPEEYVGFVERMLTNRRTRLRFDGYLSDWVPIDNGIGQGDPLSMILYLFYNADLIDVASEKGQAAVAFVDDANLYAEGDSYGEAYDSLRRMLLKAGGAKEWTETHHSRFEKSKFAVVCFSRRRVPDPMRPGKTMPDVKPGFAYEGVTVQPQGSHKFLGVLLDEELRWKLQAEKTIAKAVKWTLLFRRLSKPSTGIRAKYMRQLYTAVAIPKFTYAADIWFTPVRRLAGRKKATGSVGVVRKLTSVQRIATIAITGAMKTTATDVLEAHANILPIELLLLHVCYRAAIRLVALPASHPLHKPIKTCTNRLIRRHPSPLHNLLRTFDLKLGDYETITPALQPPNQPPLFKTDIADSREESREADLADTSDAKVYTDGSGAEGNAAASAVMYKKGRYARTLRYCLGPLADHTTYEAEATGVILALELLSKERGINTAVVLLDNQAVIQALSYVKPRPAQFLLNHAHELANIIAATSRWQSFGTSDSLLI